MGRESTSHDAGSTRRPDREPDRAARASTGEREVAARSPSWACASTVAVDGDEASLDGLAEPGRTDGDGGRAPVRPDDPQPTDAGRSSSWPYGSASVPRDLDARAARRTRVRSARRTTMPAVASWIAISGGVPRRPASAVTTPATLTTGARRLGRTVGDRDRSADAGRRSGSASGVGGRRSASASAVGVGDGVGVGVGVGGVVGRRRRGGVGLGVGARRRRRRSGGGTTANSPAQRRVQAIAGGARPAAVALAQRPGRVDTSPVCGVDSPEGGGATIDAERPAAVVDRRRRAHRPARSAPRRRPRDAETRGPRAASLAAPVVDPDGVRHRPGARDRRSTRRRRPGGWAEVARSTRPGDRDRVPAGIGIASGRVEVDGDAAGRVLDEPGPAAVDRTEIRRQHALDGDRRAVRQSRGVGDRVRIGVGVGSGSAWESGSAIGVGVGVGRRDSASASGVGSTGRRARRGSGSRSASASGSRSARCRSRRRRRHRVGVGSAPESGVGVGAAGTSASGGAARFCGLGVAVHDSRPRCRSCRCRCRRRRPAAARGSTRRRRRRGRPLDERVRGIAPADRVDRRAADDPQRRPHRPSPRTRRVYVASAIAA